MSTRFLAPSFRVMVATWFLTVPVARWSADAISAAALVASGDPSLFALDRPGTYSLVAAPAFGLLAWSRSRAIPR